MFQRNVLLELTKWSKRTKRKPMVLREARQVGKTILVEIFSKQFPQYLYLNLELKEDRQPFESFTIITKLTQTLFIQKNLSYNKKEDTLIFIDEIQELPEAMNLLRYFYEQEPTIP